VEEVLRDRDFDLDTDIDGIEPEEGNGKSSTPIELELETVSRSSPQDVNRSSRAVTRSTSESGDRRF